MKTRLHVTCCASPALVKLSAPHAGWTCLQHSASSVVVCCADMLSLITCAAKQAGEPSTHDLLRMSNVSPQEIAKWKAPNAIAMVT